MLIDAHNHPNWHGFNAEKILETVLKLVLPLLGDALLPCHSEPFGFAQDKLRAAKSKERGTTGR